MKVEHIEEQEDGSAIVTLDLTNEEVSQLLEYAILDLLKKEVNK